MLTYLPNLVNIVLINVIKIILTRCQIFHLKCTKFNFGWGSAPDPTGGAHNAPADPLAGFGEGKGKGWSGGVRTGKREEGWELRRGRKVKRKGEGRGREGREGKGRRMIPGARGD